MIEKKESQPKVRREVFGFLLIDGSDLAGAKGRDRTLSGEKDR